MLSIAAVPADISPFRAKFGIAASGCIGLYGRDIGRVFGSVRFQF
jgi:hypothetical protein